MKKLIIATCIVAFALFNSAQAQVVTLCSASQRVFSNRADAISALRSGLPGHMYLNEMNMRATRDFLKRFQNPTDVQCPDQAGATSSPASIRASIAGPPIITMVAGSTRSGIMTNGNYQKM